MAWPSRVAAAGSSQVTVRERLIPSPVGQPGRRFGGDALEPVAQGAPRAFEDEVAPVDHEAVVGADQDPVQLPCELLGIDVGSHLARGLRLADAAREALDPILAPRNDRVADRPRLA